MLEDQPAAVVAVVAEAVVEPESQEVEVAGLEILPVGVEVEEGEEVVVVVFAQFVFGMDLLGPHAQVDQLVVREQPPEEHRRNRTPLFCPMD